MLLLGSILCMAAAAGLFLFARHVQGRHREQKRRRLRRQEHRDRRAADWEEATRGRK